MKQIFHFRYPLTFCFLLITLLAGPQGCATNPVTGKQDFVLMSEADEINLGRKYHQQVTKEMPVYPDRKLAAYIEQVGQRMARVGDRPQLRFQFTLLDSKEVNAFALPGGYIYITRGLLAYLNSEAELAAVLGHEIGHVTARHSVRQQSAATVTGLAGAILQATTGVQGSSDLFNVAGKAVLSGYGREHELEADRLGARYLARAGYDPQAMIEVIGVLKNQELFEKQRAREEGREPRSYHGVFASHPKNDKRLQEVVGEAAHLKVSGKPRVAREGFLDYMDGLAFGDSEDNGVVLKGRFLHKPLDFGLNFPEDWKIENLPDRLITLAPQQKAYMEIRVEPLKDTLTPFRYLQQKGFKTLRNGRELTIAGQRAYTATTELNTKFGQRITRLTVLYADKHAYLFIGLSHEKTDQPRFDPLFQKIARSFHRLSAKEKQLASGLHIKLITASPGIRFSTLARQSPIPKYAEAQLRLLNNLFPDGEPVAGQRLKIVR
ncbi:putative Zn-dependent protease [Thiogranum longum]|uniref:Putative Zn-dependent protease n=1 Tax=Thiogranum longum TaxID=1537524 RepID=A0A4R1H978_9GAMM|nr:M48 family metalloprotease [Thiogranum longum]TCK17023.1 putative Zn-dependent protease [Thiogranum longum]